MSSHSLKDAERSKLRLKKIAKPTEFFDFQFLKLLGHGSYGKVWLCKHNPSKNLVAIKCIKKKSIEKMKLWTQVCLEAEIQSSFTHPNIIRLYDVFIHRNYVSFIQEFAFNGSLHSIIRNQKYKRFNNNVSAKFMFQVTSAVAECHNRGIIHGDIKSDNILADIHGNAKLTDFGLSCHCRDISSVAGGTLEYLPPEVIRGLKFDHRLDHWSLGVLCYEFIVGKTPFHSRNKKITATRIIHAEYDFPKNSSVDDDAKDLIRSLLVKDYEDRLPLEEVLSHKWILNHYSPGNPQF